MVKNTLRNTYVANLIAFNIYKNNFYALRKLFSNRDLNLSLK